MIIKLIISVLIFQLSLAQTSPQKALECKSPRSKICLLQVVTMMNFHVPTFPDLTDKHTLQIRSGNIPDFSRGITSQFGSVTKVTLGRLNIGSLHIPANWLSLNAESNQIRELIVDSSDDITPADQPLSDSPAENFTEVGHGDTLTVPSNGTTQEPAKNITIPSVIISADYAESTTEISPEGTGSDSNTTVVSGETAKDEPNTLSEATTVGGYKLQLLNLANNKLQTIRELKDMVNLKELCLDGNELHFIEMATFDRMTKLRKLSLAKNKINHITSPQPMELPSLEWFSVAFNELTTLQVTSWNMQQMVEMDLSHNKLVKLDVENFDRFVSLEKLALADNSWTCYWLNEALKKVSKGDFITLVDRNDNLENCPNGLPVEGICCSLTVQDEDVSNNDNLNERLQRFQIEQERMGNDLKGKISSLEREWIEESGKLDRGMAERKNRIDTISRELKDDNRVTEQDIKDLKELIADCNNLLANMERLRKENGNFAPSFTHSFYTAIDLKNKLLAAMRNAAKLEEELKKYEISFNADVN